MWMCASSTASCRSTDGEPRKDEVATYHRIFAVADTVAADKISAELKSGVLTIHLPKIEAVKPKRIAVNG